MQTWYSLSGQFILMYLISQPSYPSIRFVSKFFRPIVSTSNMTIVKSGGDALDRRSLENLSLRESKDKPYRDRARYRAKKRQWDAQFSNDTSEGASHKSPNPVGGAHAPIWSPPLAPQNRASVSNNRLRPRSRVNNFNRYTILANPRRAQAGPDSPKLGQPTNKPPLIPSNKPHWPPTEHEPAINRFDKSQNSSFESSIKASNSTSNSDGFQNLPVPLPADAYLSLASLSTKALSVPQPLLLILDLNGALIYRAKGSIDYKSRPRVSQFLKYCFANHTVLVWSSAMPRNVDAVCRRLFSQKQLEQVLGVWGRDTFGLTPQQYKSKIQVYKRLDRIWDDPTLTHKHPETHLGTRWSQKNTLLIDDSIIKASAQPYNLVQLPEFTKDSKEKKRRDQTDILGQVVAYLEEARMWDNVSSFVREKKFIPDTDWSWDWKSQKRIVRDISSSSDSDSEGGGVRLDGFASVSSSDSEGGGVMLDA